MANSLSPPVNTNRSRFLHQVFAFIVPSVYGDQALSCCSAKPESPFFRKKNKKNKTKSSPQLHFYRLQSGGRGRQDQVPEQDGSADHLQRHASQCLPEKEVSATLATPRNRRAPPSERANIWDFLTGGSFKCRRKSSGVDSLNRNEGRAGRFPFQSFFVCGRTPSARCLATVIFRLAARKLFHRLGEKEERERRRRHWTVFRFTKKREGRTFVFCFFWT